jgi:hypothetical protein
VNENGDYCYLPEALRVKAGLLLSMPTPSVGDAEACFTQSLELSRRQGTRAWELRTATAWHVCYRRGDEPTMHVCFCSRSSSSLLKVQTQRI